jgi:tetratricopeptide (TPR) repeat protein
MTSMLRGTLAALAFTSTVWLAATAAAANDRDACMKESGDEAIAAFTRAINSGRYSGRQLAVLLINRCAEWPEKQENDKAIEDCSQAIQLDPTSAEAFGNRGHAYYSKGQYDRAIEDLIQAIQLNPNDADLFNNRGLAYNDKGQNDRAIEDFNQVIRLNPNDADAFYNRGVSWERKSDLQRALADSRSSPNWSHPIRMVQRQLSASRRR